MDGAPGKGRQAFRNLGKPGFAHRHPPGWPLHHTPGINAFVRRM